MVIDLQIISPHLRLEILCPLFGTIRNDTPIFWLQTSSD